MMEITVCKLFKFYCDYFYVLTTKVVPPRIRLKLSYLSLCMNYIKWTDFFSFRQFF